MFLQDTKWKLQKKITEEKFDVIFTSYFVPGHRVN